MRITLRGIFATIAIVCCVIAIANCPNPITVQERIEFVSFHRNRPCLTFSKVQHAKKVGFFLSGEFRRDIITISFSNNKCQRLFRDEYTTSGFDYEFHKSDNMNQAESIVVHLCRSADFNPRTEQIVSRDVHNNDWIFKTLSQTGFKKVSTVTFDANIACSTTSRDGVFAFYGFDRMIVYDVVKKRTLVKCSIRPFTVSGSFFSFVDVSPCGSRLAFTSSHGMFVQDIPSGNLVTILGLGPVSFTGSGDLFFIGYGIKVLRHDSDKPCDVVSSSEPFSLLSLSDTRLVASAGKKVFVFDQEPEEQALPKLELQFAQPPDAIAISPDSSMIAVATHDSVVRIYSADGTLLWSDSGRALHKSTVAALISLCIAVISTMYWLVARVRSKRRAVNLLERVW